jgi:hypothetical protein
MAVNVICAPASTACGVQGIIETAQHVSGQAGTVNVTVAQE